MKISAWVPNSFRLYQKKKKKDAYFLKIYYHTSFQDPIVSAASVAPSKSVHASELVFFVIAGN
jgi:hypothetical protein